MPKITKRMAALLSAIVVGMSTVPAYAQSEVSVIQPCRDRECKYRTYKIQPG